ncbi:MAG: hypothetical protein GY927_14470 [bacterium]|nr:hypothetical protein [bacterium]
MLELHQFAPTWDLPNGSPFCMKIEAYQRLANIEYEMQLVTGPCKGSNGKAPWIIDGEKNTSRQTLDYLERFAFTQNHFSWRFCSVFGAKKLENIQIYPTFLHLKPNQNSSADSDPE